jgi:hypothetical protein
MADAPTGQFWIEPASTQNLPSPTELRRLIHDNLEKGYQHLRDAQGEVHTPEDTFRMQRALAATRERFTDWAAAFREGARRIAEMQQEQLIEAVGERHSTASHVGIDGEPEYRPTGVPNQGLTVPDPAGDFRLSLDFTTARDFDLDQLVKVVALEAAGYAIGAGADLPEGAELAPYTGMVEAGIRRFLELGKFEPQVTKVNAYAQHVARTGDDLMASVVNGSITSRKVYQGVSVKRSTT